MAGIFKTGISRNTKRDILVGFPKSGHVFRIVILCVGSYIVCVLIGPSYLPFEVNNT